MTEAEKHKEFEELCGEADRAFRLLRLHTACIQAASGTGRTLMGTPINAEERFIRRATQEGYSSEEINAFLSL